MPLYPKSSIPLPGSEPHQGDAVVSILKNNLILLVPTSAENPQEH